MDNNRFGRVEDGQSLSEAIISTSPVAFWPLDEQSGLTIFDVSGNGHHGVYSGPTLNATPGPHGSGAPQFDAINDFGKLKAASLSASLTNNAEGSMLVFAKVRASSVWTDASERRILVIASAGQTEMLMLRKNSANHNIQFLRNGGGTVFVSGAVPGGVGPTGWFAMAMTWSQPNNRLRAWYSTVGSVPAQFGTTQAGGSAWVGADVNSDRTCFGTGWTDPPPTLESWDGYIGGGAVWSKELDFASQLSPLMVL